MDYMASEGKFSCELCNKKCSQRSDLKSHIARTHAEETIPCDQCDEIFSNKVYLKRHKGRKHIKSRKFPCPQCEKKFHHKPDVRGHINQVHSTCEPFQCPICPSKLKTHSSWRFHRKIHQDRVGHFPCELCNKIFSRRHSLDAHIKACHMSDKEKLEQCPSCQKVFEWKSKLLSHVERAHKEKTLPCDQCEMKFSNKTSLIKHIGRKHIKSRTFPCPQCEKKFYDMPDVRTHISQVHSKYEPYQCDMCPSKFKRNSNWNNHRKTHFDNKPFKCAVCMKMFKHQTSLTNCLRRHDNPGLEYPCTVDDCDSVLKTEEGRRVHMKKHEVETRVVCKICTRVLSTKSELTRHMKNVHGNLEKNFACSVCDFKWATKYQLENHMKIHSNKIFSCSFEGCKSQSNTQYGLNFHFKRKHGKVKHRKPIEEIERDQNKRFVCEICDKSFKLGKAPLFIMNAHRKTHENQESLDCVVKDCTKKIFPKKNMTGDKSCNLPIEFYKHMESVHAISFDEYQVEATFTCKLCENLLNLRSVKQTTSTKIGSSISNWGATLRTHMERFHGEHIKAVGQNLTWNSFFVRKHLSLEKVQPLSFIDQLFAEKTCKLNCDFQASDEKFPSAFRKKLLRHYSIEHFGAELLEMESKYFKGQRFPICTLCGFEIKRPVENLITKAAHIGVNHKEIVPILTNHFSKIQVPMNEGTEGTRSEKNSVLKTTRNQMIEELVKDVQFEIGI